MLSHLFDSDFESDESVDKKLELLKLDDNQVVFETLHGIQEEFKPPRALDEELIKATEARARSERSRTPLIMGLSIAVGIAGGAITSGIAGLIGWAEFPLYVISFLFFALVFSGSFMARELSRAFAKRQYDLVSKQAQSALLWNAWGLPFTWFSFRSAIMTYYSLLIVEGRFVELEVVSRYSLARRSQGRSKKQNWVGLNNLAVALIGQMRFEDAIPILKELLESTKDPFPRSYFLNNLAFCSIRLKQLSEAERYWNEAISLKLVKPVSPINCRLQLIKGLIETQKENYDEAEKHLREAERVAELLHEPLEVIASVNGAMAIVRLAQGRMDEAELLQKNVISALESAPNPAYFALACHLGEYAAQLNLADQIELARKAWRQAQSAYEHGVERDRQTVESLAVRLQSRKRIWVSSQLIAGSVRIPLAKRTVM